ncbi:MAG: hypothetical protein GX846_01760 [Deltaproteobacteria bacterium]|nr:hypothetical protein [Deltaproteobacteria bacterium]
MPQTSGSQAAVTPSSLSRAKARHGYGSMGLGLMVKPRQSMETASCRSLSTIDHSSA